PLPVARRCSAASRVLRSCPTSRVRSPSACVLGLPDALCGSLSRREARDLPVPVRSASGRARGLRPRGVPVPLALATHWVWPSAYLHGVGTPEWFMDFAAQYPARSFPCQRFAPVLADRCA